MTITTNKPEQSYSFREFSFETDDDLLLMVKWDNDPTIRYLHSPAFTKEQSEHKVTLEELKSLPNEGDPRSGNFILEWNGKPVGHLSCQFGMQHRLTKDPNTAWFGIIIGEAEARGHGLGKICLQFLEEYARKNGAHNAEVGVFEFNEISQKLFQSAGYKEIGSVPEFTYWNDRKWADIRYLKTL